MCIDDREFRQLTAQIEGLTNATQLVQTNITHILREVDFIKDRLETVAKKVTAETRKAREREQFYIDAILDLKNKIDGNGKTD